MVCFYYEAKAGKIKGKRFKNLIREGMDETLSVLRGRYDLGELPGYPGRIMVAQPFFCTADFFRIWRWLKIIR